MSESIDILPPLQVPDLERSFVGRRGAFVAAFWGDGIEGVSTRTVDAAFWRLAVDMSENRGERGAE